MEVQSKLVALADENKAQKQMIEKIKGDYDTIEQRFEELNKRLEETLKVNGRMRQFIDTLPHELQPKFPF
jgi:predicted nuclease with TOPRIM domain